MTQRALLAPPPLAAEFLVFDLAIGADPRASLRALRSSLDAAHVVVGLGQPLVLALGSPITGLRPFPALAGPGVAAPSTQGALWAFVRGDDASACFDRARAVSAALGDAFVLSEEVSGFRYRDGRDLSGYVDGTANPEDDAAVAAAIVHGKGPGQDGSSFVAGQRWVHSLSNLAALSQAERDDLIGRRQSDNEEMDQAPASAHVKRTEQEAFHDPDGFMLRRSMPWGGVGEHGLYFVAFVESLERFERSLCRMLGLTDGVVDGLFRFTRPVSGGYYWCPPLEGGKLDLRRFGL